MPTIVKQDDTGEKPTPEKRKPVPAGFRKFTKEMADHLASETYKAACVGGYANQMRVFFKKIVDIGNRYLKVDAHILIPFFFHFLRRIRMAVPSAAELSVSGTVSNPAVKDVLPMHLHMLMLRDFMGPEAVKCTQAITTKGHGPFIGPGHAICFGTPFTRKLRVLFPATRDGDKQWRLDDDLPVLDANTFWTAIHFNAGVADTVMRGFLADESNKQSDAADAQLRFDVWIKAFEEGRRSYEADPVNNLSVEGHRDAEVFRAFVAPYMSGSVLDIGCGPQELPVYLRGFRLDRVAGLDPLPGVAKRRMDFCQGFAEFLPWEDAQFDVVLFATSLDHVLSLEKTLDEVCRVLRPGGKCIVWAGLIPGSARYEPDREPVVAVDDYHLFHFSESTLLETFRARFDLFESCVYKANNGFYVFSPSSDL